MYSNVKRIIVKACEVQLRILLLMQLDRKTWNWNRQAVRAYVV